MSNKCILSICIPTYNRGDILKNTIKKFIEDPSFDDRVEIVISDNCSDDNTQEVSNYYVSQYRNIRYFRNEKNIYERNFIAALLHGQGLYLKLHNDYNVYKAGMLDKTLSIITASLDKQNTLFFVQNNHDWHDVTLHSKGLDELIQKTSYALCWIGNVGIWKASLLQMGDNYYDFADYNYLHVDLCLKAVTNYPETIIHYADYYNLEGIPSNKAWYNVFQVNVNNLLLVFMGFESNRRLNQQTINLLKLSVFENVAFGLFLTILKHFFLMKKKPIITAKWFTIMYKNYGLMWILYFIRSFIKYLINRILK